jgi:hypothetical protein
MNVGPSECTICIYGGEMSNGLCSHKLVTMGVVLGIRHGLGQTKIEVCNEHAPMLESIRKIFDDQIADN